MFENMSNAMPAYQEYIAELSVLAQQQGKEISERLIKAMGYMYSDLIQFCFDAYRLLSKKRHGKILLVPPS